MAALLYGLQADRFGVHRVTFPSLAAFVLLTVLTATAQSIERLILWRAVTTNGGDLRADPRRKGHPSGNRSEQPAHQRQRERDDAAEAKSVLLGWLAPDFPANPARSIG